jgi:hypothetical protein
MADVGAIHTLTTPGGTVIFNNGTLHSLDDLYWIQEIDGLDGAPRRAPIDPKPLAHGGLVHDMWKGPRDFTVEGVILIQSAPLGDACRTARNTKEAALMAALDSILAADGTWSWTPIGLGARSLTVRNPGRVEFKHQDDYALLGFTFGLVAANPDW